MPSKCWFGSVLASVVLQTAKALTTSGSPLAVPSAFALVTTVPLKLTLMALLVRIGAWMMTLPPVLSMLAPPAPPETSKIAPDATVMAPEPCTF